jgi:hypothetical protein
MFLSRKPTFRGPGRLLLAFLHEYVDRTEWVPGVDSRVLGAFQDWAKILPWNDSRPEYFATTSHCMLLPREATFHRTPPSWVSSRPTERKSGSDGGSGFMAA